MEDPFGVRNHANNNRLFTCADTNKEFKTVTPLQQIFIYFTDRISIVLFCDIIARLCVMSE